MKSEQVWSGMIQEHENCESMAVALATEQYGRSMEGEEGEKISKEFDDEITKMMREEREFQEKYEEKTR